MEAVGFYLQAGHVRVQRQAQVEPQRLRVFRAQCRVPQPAARAARRSGFQYLEHVQTLEGNAPEQSLYLQPDRLERYSH